MAVGPIQGAATSAFSIAGIVGGMIGKGVSDIEAAHTAGQQREKIISDLKVFNEGLVEGATDGITEGKVQTISALMKTMKQYADDPYSVKSTSGLNLDEVYGGITDKEAKKYGYPTRKEVEEAFYNYATTRDELAKAEAEADIDLENYPAYTKLKADYEAQKEQLNKMTDAFDIASKNEAKAQEELNASRSREFRGFNKYADMANNHLVEAQRQKSIQNQMKARNIR